MRTAPQKFLERHLDSTMRHGIGTPSKTNATEIHENNRGHNHEKDSNVLKRRFSKDSVERDYKSNDSCDSSPFHHHDAPYVGDGVNDLLWNDSQYDMSRKHNASALDGSEVKDSEVEDSEVEDSEVEDSEVEDSEVEDSEIEDSDVEDSDVEKSQIEDSEVKDSEVENSEQENRNRQHHVHKRDVIPPYERRRTHDSDTWWKTDGDNVGTFFPLNLMYSESSEADTDDATSYTRYMEDEEEEEEASPQKLKQDHLTENSLWTRECTYDFDEFMLNAHMASRRASYAERTLHEIRDTLHVVHGMKRRVLIHLHEISRSALHYEAKYQQHKQNIKRRTKQAIDDILTSGWSRAGHFGFVDITQMMEPFLTTIRHYKLNVDSKQDDGDRRPRVLRFVDTHARPEEPKHEGPDSNDFFTSFHSDCGATLCEDLGQNVGLSCLPTRPPLALGESNELSDEESGLVEPAGSAQRNAPMSIGIQRQHDSHRVNDLPLTKGTIPRRSSDHLPNAYFILTQTQESSPMSSHRSYKTTREKNRDREDDLLSASSGGSLSTQTTLLVNETFRKMKGRGCCVKSVERFWEKCLRLGRQSPEEQKKELRKSILRYYRSKKKWARQLRGILPGGLSPISLPQPPEPHYRSEPFSSTPSGSESEDVLSNLLSHDSEISDDNGTLDFTLTSALSASNDEASTGDESNKKHISFAHRTTNAINRPGSLCSGEHTPPIKEPQYVYTTTFQIGTTNKTPAILTETVHNIVLSSQLQSHKYVSDLDDMHRNLLCYDSCIQPQKMPCECHVHLIDELFQHKGSRPAKVTEFWQLIDDARHQRAIWVYRGRIITPSS